MSDIDRVYRVERWDGPAMISFLVMGLGVASNRLHVWLGKPAEILEIVSLRGVAGCASGWVVMRNMDGDASIKHKFATRDELSRFLHLLLRSDRFDNFTYVPYLGATRTVFRHQLIFGGDRRFDEWSAPSACCPAGTSKCCPPDVGVCATPHSATMQK